jgi:hypothetical protein
MMRFLGLIAISFSLLVNPCFAGSLSKGDIVKLDYTYSTAYGPNGGELHIFKQVPGGFEFVARSFCLEYNESYLAGERYKVGAISDRAIFGGVNTQTGDILDAPTKFLYDSYSNGSLASFGTGYVYSDSDSRDSLQNAIWSIEGERALTGTGPDILAEKLVDLANTQVAANPSRVYGSLAVNLFDISTPDALINAFNPLDLSTWTAISSYRRQDHLYPGHLVPEPSSAVIFALGLTVAGAARLRSRFRKAA